MIFIDLESKKTEIQSLLIALNWISDEKVIEISKPGEGNMNVVLRIKTNKRSFILKQSRQYVQKYQQIDAPIDRIDTEYRFYQSVRNNKQELNMPKILAYDPSNYLLMMEDLGDCLDMTSLYETRIIDSKQIDNLISTLKVIHASKVDGTFPKNMELRILNHQHIYELPFVEDNGFDLDAVQIGLAALAKSVKSDVGLFTKIKLLGEQYLSDAGNTLIHGDYYPGSWMHVNDDTYVLDPEFSFVGHKEFDLGVMGAHLLIASMDNQITTSVLSKYNEEVNESLVHQIVGVEIIRRLIGLAQLPLKRTLEEKDNLLSLAADMIHSN